MVTLDHVDNLTLTDDEVREHADELRSLSYLAQGLWFLNDQVRKIETVVADRMAKGESRSIIGNDPLMKGIPQELVACAFHWHAVTSRNYVKMVGWLSNGEDSSKAGLYMERILPQVYLWRHKVAAHFAIIDPKKKDIPADLAMSVVFPIFFDDAAFYARALSSAIVGDGKSSSSRKDMRWSLTQTHSRLVERYWPPKSNT